MARNSLDRVRDSLVATQQMLFAAKPNCYVLLDYTVNAGEKQKLQGDSTNGVWRLTSGVLTIADRTYTVEM